MAAPALSRRNVLIGLGAAVAAPALLRFQMRLLHAEELGLPMDGQSNALPSLKRMLSAAEARGKGTVRLPEGRFVLAPSEKGAAITMPANVRLEGAGMDKTFLVMADGADGHVINSPYGYIQIADLTVDGNAAKRPNTVGHNIRLQSDHSLLERVRSLDAVSYGIGVGQKLYARNVTIRDVEIINAGADGIDVKNNLGRTENVLIERVTVRGFGRIDPRIPADEVGSRFDRRKNKAGVDLRGPGCHVRDLTIIGVLKGRNGLRFRPGETTTSHGPGAHGATAVGVVIKGEPGKRQGTGIRVAARGVRVSNIDVQGMRVGIKLTAEDLEVRKGRLTGSTDAAITTLRSSNAARPGGPDRVVFEDVTFRQGTNFNFDSIETAVFDRCTFSDCSKALQQVLTRDRRVLLKDCTFDGSCRS